MSDAKAVLPQLRLAVAGAALVISGVVLVRRRRRDVGGGSWNHLFMDQSDLVLRNLTYRQFVELGRAPTPEEISRAAGSTIGEVEAGWRRLHDQHALVIDPDTHELRMANPFSAVPTPYRVLAADRWWYGNCAWDAFGICAALRDDGRIETSCPDCGDPITVEVRGQRPDDETLVFHCLVPARQWWDDIGFT